MHGRPSGPLGNLMIENKLGFGGVAPRTHRKILIFKKFLPIVFEFHLVDSQWESYAMSEK